MRASWSPVLVVLLPTFAAAGLVDQVERALLSITDCGTCHSALPTFKAVANLGDAAFVRTITAACIDLKIEDPDVCEGAIRTQGPILAHDLRHFSLWGQTATKFCEAVFGLCEPPAVNAYEVPFPKPAPENPKTFVSRGRPPFQMMHFSDAHIDRQYTNSPDERRGLVQRCVVSNALRARAAGSWHGNATALEVSRSSTRDGSPDTYCVRACSARRASSVFRELRSGNADGQLQTGHGGKHGPWCGHELGAEPSHNGSIVERRQQQAADVSLRQSPVSRDSHILTDNCRIPALAEHSELSAVADNSDMHRRAINCSAYAPSSSVRVPPPTSGPPVAPTATVDGPLTHPDECPAPPTSPERTSSRSCECLTQTLCCHGCGTPVGYMIVSPCRRCTSSISVSNRTTNGHRFVFYSAEVAAEERHYVAGKRGVIPFHPPATAPTAQSTAVSRHPGFSPALFYTYTMGAAQGLARTNDPAGTSEGRDQLLMHATESMSQAHSRTLSATSSDSMPPLTDPESPFRHVHSSPPSPSRPSPPPPTRTVSSHPTNAADSPHLDVTGGPPAPPEAPVRLRVGEVLHWHNLVRSGEIPPVCDDARARRKGLGVEAKSYGYDFSRWPRWKLKCKHLCSIKPRSAKADSLILNTNELQA
ncbi:predicted protein [Postia placenta Mad-698-R]|nr:predicted protein [Postia placenta Mad-698-R]